MSRGWWKLPALALVCLVQLAVPARMILEHERTLSRGELFRFQVAPVDPYDPFRGRYVLLSFDAETVPGEPGDDLEPGDRVFATIAEDEDGFAQVIDLGRKRPQGGAYLRARVRRIPGDHVQLDFPFERYYMEESLAPEAERAYREHTRREKIDAFVTVRVRGGRAVLEELYLAGMPILEYLEREQP